MTRLSRRKVVLGLGSVPLLAQGRLERSVEADPVLLLCAEHGDLTRRQDALMRRWGDQEDWLSKNRNWFALSEAEQRSRPEAQVLTPSTKSIIVACVRTRVSSGACVTRELIALMELPLSSVLSPTPSTPKTIRAHIGCY